MIFGGHNTICLLMVLQFALQAHAIGPDHAALSPKHEQAASIYIADKLKVEGHFDLDKAKTFREALELEKKQIIQDVYQTKLIESLELKVKTYEEAQRHAEGGPPGPNHEDRYRRAYDMYLIPKIDQLINGIAQGLPAEELEGIVCDFVRGYLAFKVPNAFVTRIPLDLDLIHLAVRTVFPKTYRKKDKKIEANNLIVDDEVQTEVSHCLGARRIGYYLSQEELDQLTQCGMDLSRLNPGTSPLWQKVRPKDYDAIQAEDMNEFPTEGQVVKYKGIIFRGQGSPKVKVEWKDKQGRTRYIKLKFGNEVCVDRAASKLFQLAGLNQDSMWHRSEVKVDLGNMTYDSFASSLANKYTVASLARLIHSHSKEGEKPGWFIARDVLFEAKPKTELRLGPVDFGGWDLQNRREFRSLFLIWGWLAIGDTKLPNYRLLLKENPDGTYFPQVRLHDTGFGLATSIFIRRWRNIMAFNKQYLVNEFEPEFVRQYKDKDKVQIYWNDFASRARQQDNATWNDLKWMARQIASIPSQEIYRALMDSTMPEPVALVYHLKLIHRRNGMIEAFGLENEVPKIDVPAVKDFNPYPNDPNPPVKNGKVIKTAFENKTGIVHLTETWGTLITNLASFDINLFNHVDKSTGVSVTPGLKGLQGLQFNLGFISTPTKTTIAKIPLAVGVYALLTRKVTGNTQIVNLQGMQHLFKITDGVQIRFDIESPLFRALISQVKGLSTDLSLKFYEKKFEFTHFTEKANDGFLSPFILHKIIPNLAKYATYKLKPLEMIQNFHRIGLEVSGGVGAYSAKPFFVNEVSAFGGKKKMLASYYLRDEYGRLHIYRDRLIQTGTGLNIDLATIDLFAAKFSIFRMVAGISKFDVKTTDVIFDFDELEREKSLSYLDEARRAQEYEALRAIETGRDLAPFPFVKEHFLVHSKGTHKVQGLGALYAFNLEYNKSETTTKVRLEEQGEHYFHRLTTMKNASIGIENFSLLMSNSDVLMKNRKRVRVHTEMDLDNPGKFILAIRSEDFFDIRSRQELLALISDLNRRYSKNQDTPFYSHTPDEDNLGLFRKVYGLTRVFIDGEKFIERFTTANREEFKAALVHHFSDKNDIPAHISSLPFGMRGPVKSLLNKALEIQAMLSASQGKDRQSINKEVAKKIHSLVQKLDTATYGLTFLKELIGEEGLYVMGDIAGVLPNAGTMQDPQEQQRRRFTAVAWGHYARSPVIQLFLRNQRPLQPTSLITKLMSDTDTFGSLEMGIAPNLLFTYDHNRGF